MSRKIISAIIALVMICSITANGITLYSTGHAPGEAYRTINGANCIGFENAVIDGDGSVQIGAGGKATFGFHTPYGLRAVKIVYENAVGTTKINTLDNEYTLEFEEPSGEYNLIFGEHLNIKSQEFYYNNKKSTGIMREFVEHRGEHEVTVSSTGGIKIKEMVFEKELVTLQAKPSPVPAVSEETSATYSTVILDENAPIIVRNGGKRFVDYNDTDAVPYKYNDRLYLPINTLAKALDYYHEDYPDKNYALMRSATHDVVMLDGKCYVTAGLGETKLLDEEVIVRHDGKTYAAVRYFAELIGDTVEYQDGMVVIDNKYTVEDIIEDDSLNKFAKDIFKPYKTAKVEGKTYYVAQNNPLASDEGAGTLIRPFKTLAKAAEVAEAGDTVIVREGVYRETLAPKNSGTENARITFKAMEGENVVISACEVVDGWAHYDDNIWIAPMNWDLGVTRNQVFINDKMLNEARYPNEPEVLFDTDKLDNAWAVRGDLWRPEGEENRSSVKSSTLLWQKEPDYWAGGYFAGHFGYDYSVMTANIIGSKEGELILGDEKSEKWYTNESHFNYGYIVGHMNCLDAPGEWIRKNDTLYMIFPDGAVPNETVVEAKARQLVIDLKDRSYIDIEGFKTIGGSARTNENSKLNMLNSLDMKYITHFIHQSHPYKAEIDFPFDPKKKDGNPEKGESGVYLSGYDNHIVNCNIDHTAGAGVFISGLYAYVENNIIHDSYNSNNVSGITVMTRGYEKLDTPRGGHSIYNNTVYNTGRSCLHMAMQDGTTHSAFVPSDIGYNDFHDAMLTTLDTGITYDYGVQMSTDGYATNMHHNYAYMVVGGRDKNPFSYSLYHDGHSHGVDTFKNQIFYTRPESPFSNMTPFMQHATNAPAYYRRWDNSSNLIMDGLEGLDEKYFTEGKMFYAGALRDTETMEPVEYMRNYENFASGKFVMDNTVAENVAKNAENISEGVIFDAESGYAKFTGNGQYVCFEDVEFPDNSTRVAIMARGDSHHSKDTVEIIIGDSIESGAVYEAEIDLNGYDKDEGERIIAEINQTSGTNNVWLRTKKYRSAEVGGIFVYRDDIDTSEENSYDPLDDYSAYKWAGEFDEVDAFNPNGNGRPSVLTEGAYPGKKLLSNTWPGYCIKYEDVEVTKDSDKFVMSAGSGDPYSHQPFEIYVEDKNSTKVTSKYVVRYYEDSDAWADRAPQLVMLDRVVEAGTYDIYINLPEDEGRGKCSTVISFGFLATGDIPKELAKSLGQVWGGDFDVASSKGNPNFPLETAYMNPPNYSYQGLTYTLPGACVAYKNVSVPQDTDKMTISYSTVKGLDEQPVDVYLGDPDNGGKKVASFVTKDNGGVLNFREEVIDCITEVKAGEYDVYFCFGGNAQERKTCNLEWFGFIK